MMSFMVGLPRPKLPGAALVDLVFKRVKPSLERIAFGADDADRHFQRGVLGFERGDALGRLGDGSKRLLQVIAQRPNLVLQTPLTPPAAR